jgi:hypothetical protein
VLELLRLLTEVGAAANWIAIFIAVIIAVFMGYIGIAMYAALSAREPEQQKIRYEVFQDLLKVFVRGRRR